MLANVCVARLIQDSVIIQVYQRGNNAKAVPAALPKWKTMSADNQKIIKFQIYTKCTILSEKYYLKRILIGVKIR